MFSDSATVRINTELKIIVTCHTPIGSDNIHIMTSYGNLDETDRRHSLELPKRHTFNFFNGGTKSITLPFSRAPYGWEVRVWKEPKPPSNGNSGGFDVRLEGR